MTIRLLTDAACDLPARFLTEERVDVMPIQLHLRDQMVLDQRRVSVALGFYKSYLADKDMAVDTAPLSVREMLSFFDEAAREVEHVIFIAISRTRSKIYEHAAQAAAALAQRRDANAPKAGMVHVIDSQTLFTGQGVMVYEAVQALKRGLSHLELIQHLRDLAQKIHSFLVPDDLYYLRNRASKKGDESIGLMRYMIGAALDVKPIVGARLGDTEVIAKARGFAAAIQQVFDKAAAAIDSNLSVPMIAISYAGEPKTVADTGAYRKFVAKAKQHGVNVMISVMGPTGGINVGPGALALSYATY